MIARGRFFCCFRRGLSLIFWVLCCWMEVGVKELEFGLVLALVGAGTTFLVLSLISLLCGVLKRIFPSRGEGDGC